MGATARSPARPRPRALWATGSCRHRPAPGLWRHFRPPSGPLFVRYYNSFSIHVAEFVSIYIYFFVNLHICAMLFLPDLLFFFTLELMFLLHFSGFPSGFHLHRHLKSLL